MLSRSSLSLAIVAAALTGTNPAPIKAEVVQERTNTASQQNAIKHNVRKTGKQHHKLVNFYRAGSLPKRYFAGMSKNSPPHAVGQRLAKKRKAIRARASKRGRA